MSEILTTSSQDTGSDNSFIPEWKKQSDEKLDSKRPLYEQVIHQVDLVAPDILAQRPEFAKQLQDIKLFAQKDLAAEVDWARETSPGALSVWLRDIVQVVDDSNQNSAIAEKIQASEGDEQSVESVSDDSATQEFEAEDK